MHSMLALAWLAVSGIGLAAPEGRERIASYSCPNPDVTSATADGATPTASGGPYAAGYYDASSVSGATAYPTAGVSSLTDAEDSGDDDGSGTDTTDAAVPGASSDTVTDEAGGYDASPLNTNDATTTASDGSPNPDMGAAQENEDVPGTSTEIATETSPNEGTEGSQDTGGDSSTGSPTSPAPASESMMGYSEVSDDSSGTDDSTTSSPTDSSGTDAGQSGDTDAAGPSTDGTTMSGEEGSSYTETGYPGVTDDTAGTNDSTTTSGPAGSTYDSAQNSGEEDDSGLGTDSTASSSPEGSSYVEPDYSGADDSSGATDATNTTVGTSDGATEENGGDGYSDTSTDGATSPSATSSGDTAESGYGYDSSSGSTGSTGTGSGNYSSGGTGTPGRACEDPPTSFQLSDAPYENYFYSDCNTAAQVVVTSPGPEDNLTIIGPRLLVAWPAGNSGAVTFFAPQNGINGTLAIAVDNQTSGGGVLEPVYFPPADGSEYPSVGVSGVVTLNDSAVLTLPILGSVRTIRDFTEGPSLLVPEIQNAIEFREESNGGLTLSRLWLDNETTTVFSFTPTANSSSGSRPIQINNRTATFEAGSYEFSAHFNFPQLDQLSPTEVLKPSAQGLIQEQPDQTISLSFLSYTNKLLAGAWRFLTYFGRDSMISLLLLEPVLSEGEGGAMEAGIAAVLERLNRTDGNACHEETIGDYATFLNLRNNITSTAPQFDYKMIDTDYFLPVLIKQYFLQNPTGAGRREAFFSRTPTENPANANLTYAQLALRNAERIMSLAAPFAAEGNQTKENLIALKPGEIVGNWRDSTYGLGGGRIPYDVNTALVPAGLRAIATLSREGFFPEYPTWAEEADRYAQVWEDETLRFFEVRVPAEEARNRVESYRERSQFAGPSQTETIDGDVTFYAVALDGNNGLEQVEVMNSDDCFRHYFLNTTDQEQLTGFINQTANNIQRTFPAGLLTDVGVIVANPAYGEDPVYAQNFTNGAYHGTVVWSWNSLSMMARGLELQLDRCNSDQAPDFCRDPSVSDNARRAYNKLWDTIEANSNLLSSEVWSWLYRDNRFQATPLGGLPPPPGVGGATESNIRQLWSLTFLAVRRNEAFR